MALLYGVHDQEGAQLVPPGGWCVALVELSSNPAPVNYAAIRPDINWLVRVNWGYGSTGTIPLLANLNSYLSALVTFAAGTQGAHAYVIGNEPQHEQERPNGVVITVGHYLEYFVAAHKLLKQINSNNRVIPAAPAPYHASPVKWTDFWRGVLTGLVQRNVIPDALAIHAYVRRHEQDALYSTERMGGILGEQFSGFFTYRDALGAVPAALRHLPVHITEFCPIPGWKDENNGLVQAAYKEINWWNQQPDTQKVHSLDLYRFPAYDKWGFQDKPGVIADFQAAVAMGLSSPQEGQGAMQTHQVVLPSVKAPANSPAPSTGFESPMRHWDTRALARGVEVKRLPPPQPDVAWRVVKIKWLDEQQSQGRHHIYFDTLDEAGNRVAGVPIVVVWPNGAQEVVSEAKPGEPYSANFPMSPSRNEFGARVNDGVPSETVLGIGMGADTPGGFNAGIHTSTEVIFQRIRSDAKEQTPVGLGHNLDNLVHPVEKPEFRTITQGWAERPEFYSRYSVDGVPLKGHNGLDFGTPVGTPIVAVDTGQVVEVADDPQGYGQYVKLVHPWGESLYAHLSRQLVRVGDTVKQGFLLGFSGNTGNSTGPHLHFGMRVNPFNRRDGWGGFVNPAPYLGIKDAPVVAPIPDAPEIPVLIKNIAWENNLEWQLLASMVWAESSFNPRAESGAGAIGLMQLMPATFDEWSERVGASDIWLPEHNLKVGAAYLKYLINYMNGDVRKALWSYVWGMGRVKSGDTPPPEVLEYANKILHGRDLLKAVGA